MDVLLISRCPPFPLYHGDRLIPYHLARELTNRGHRIDLLAFYQHPRDLAETPRYERFFNDIRLFREPRRSLRSYRTRNAKEDARFPTRAEESWSPEMWRAVEDVIQTRPYDIAHVFGGVQVYEYLHLVRQLPNIIVPYESYSLWLERDLQHTQGLIKRWMARLQLRMARDFESWMFEHYERVVVLTDRDARAMRELNPHTPLVVIPNGVDIDRFKPTGFEPDEPALLFIGNYDYAPNLDAALRLVRHIFPKIKEVVPQARLYIVGSDPPPHLLAYASDAVNIPGRVPDIRPYYEMAMIFLSPLRLGAGIKNKVLEAMAMGTPVVATQLSCDGIPVIQGQHVMLGRTDDELVEHVLELLRIPRLRRQLAVNARQLIQQRFTWNRVAAMYDELYFQVIEEHRLRFTPGLPAQFESHFFGSP
jgi:glycosyltransferase involved in cell wall biosynthesis